MAEGRYASNLIAALRGGQGDFSAPMNPGVRMFNPAARAEGSMPAGVSGVPTAPSQPMAFKPGILQMLRAADFISTQPVSRTPAMSDARLNSPAVLDYGYGPSPDDPAGPAPNNTFSYDPNSLTFGIIPSIVNSPGHSAPVTDAGTYAAYMNSLGIAPGIDTPSSDYANTYGVAPGIDTPSDGGGGDGGKIICTKLYELGRMPQDIYEADQKFGAELVRTSPETYDGYAAWAKHVVRLMERKDVIGKVVVALADAIATPWSIAMAQQMGVSVESGWFGRLLMKRGLQVCKLIGRARGKRLAAEG